jgi:hypothetical protein
LTELGERIEEGNGLPARRATALAFRSIIFFAHEVALIDFGVEPIRNGRFFVREQRRPGVFAFQEKPAIFSICNEKLGIRFDSRVRGAGIDAHPDGSFIVSERMTRGAATGENGIHVAVENLFARVVAIIDEATARSCGQRAQLIQRLLGATENERDQDEAGQRQS